MAGNPFNGASSAQFYVDEVEPGITPANPVWKLIRSTAGIPTLIKDTLESNELNDSREVRDVRTGNEQVQGEYSVELSQTSHDDFIANAQSSEWVTGLTGNTEVTVDDATKTFTRTAGDFVSDGIQVGDLIYFADLTGNNALPFTVTTVTATVITGGGITLTLTDETATTDYQTGDKVGTGNLCKTISILTWLKGKCGTPDRYILSAGVEFSGFSYEVAVNAQVTGSFPFLGRSMTFPTDLPAGSTFAPEVDTRPYTGVDGKVLVDGELEAAITTATITNDNTASAQFVLCGKGAAHISRGKAKNTLSISAFMFDTDLIEKFVNETRTFVSIVLNGPDGAMSFTTPDTALTAATPEIAGEDDITQTLEGTATGDRDNSSLVVQRITY